MRAGGLETLGSYVVRLGIARRCALEIQESNWKKRKARQNENKARRGEKKKKKKKKKKNKKLVNVYSSTKFDPRSSKCRQHRMSA